MGWHFLDFRHVHMTQCLPSDYYVEASDLMANKAISTGRDYSIENYDSTAYRAYYEQAPPQRSQIPSRVIPTFLFTPTISVKEAIDNVEKHQVLQSDKILTAVFKEKDPDARVRYLRLLCDIAASSS